MRANFLPGPHFLPAVSVFVVSMDVVTVCVLGHISVRFCTELFLIFFKWLVLKA